MARRYAMAIDLRTCLGCGGCVVACMTENERFGYSRCRVTEEVRGSWPRPEISFTASAAITAMILRACRLSDGGQPQGRTRHCRYRPIHLHWL